MNILFTSDLSGMGGGETSLTNLCQVMKKENNVCVVCDCDGKLVTILKQMGVDVIVLNYRNKKKLIVNLFKLRSIIKNKKINIIHSNDPITSIIFKVAALGTKSDNFWTCHGQWYDFSFIKKLLIRWSNRHVFCVSSKVQENLTRMGFKYTSVTYLGIPLEKYEYAESSKLRQELRLNSKDYLIATIGRFQRIKGQLKLVQAVESLIRNDPNLILLLIGGCIYNNQEEKEYFEEIKDYISNKGLQENIFFVGERSDIPNIMHEIDLLVIPSDNESFGMVAIEALASGLPVLSTPNDGVSEILMYHKNMLAPSNDPDGLHFVIQSYLNSREIQEAIYKYEMKRKKDFDIQVVAKKYVDIFTKNGGKRCTV